MRRQIILLFISIIISVTIANSIIIISDPHHRHSTALWIMNITAAAASSLGIIAMYRHGVSDFMANHICFDTRLNFVVHCGPHDIVLPLCPRY